MSTTGPQFFSNSQDVTLNNSVIQNFQGDLHQYNSDPDNIELNGLAYADGGAGYNTTKQCLVGTRIEILDEIEQWAHSTEPNVPPVFWINGAAGTGKSAIAHTLALRFHQRNELGSFLSFDRTYLAERRHEKVFSTVARDLASHNPGVRRPLAAVIRERNWLKRTADIIQQWESLVITPSAHLPTDHPILLVIDALDESGDIQSRKHLLSILAHRAVELPSNVRILLTSRPLDDILQALQSSIHVISKVIDDLPKSSINRDIRSYISARLTQVNGFVFDDNRLQILVNHSEGLFQWAFVACEFIQGSGRLFSPEKRYHKLTNPSNTASLTKLDMLYDTILQEVCPDNDEDDMQVFCSVMGQILASFEPLPLDALTVIRAQFPSRAVDADDVYSVLKHMGSVLSGITNHSIPIRPLHSSFRDYLTDPRRSRNFYIDISQHSSDLAFAMLQIMDTGLHFNISSLENSYLLNSEVFNLAQKVEQSISTPLSYSCRHWASHVQATPFDSKIATQVRKFLNQQFLYWMEVLSLVKSVHIVAHSMSLIINWINGHGQYKDILDFAVDAQKFVGVFGGVISQSTPHLYLSALPFAPANSIIYRKFSPKFPHAAKVVSGQMTSWPRCQNIWHTPGVACIVFSPDGKHIISGSENGTISIWDAEIGEIVTGPLKEHTEQVNAIGISPDGKYIISGSRDKTICIWDAKTGDAMIAPLKGHTGSVLSVIFSPDGKHIISCSNDHTIRIWDAKTGEPLIAPFQKHTGSVTCIAVSQDGKLIVSGSGDKTVCIWNAETGEVVGVPLTGHSDWITFVAFSPDNKHIISGSNDNTICTWDVKTGDRAALPFTLPIKGSVTSIAFSPDGKIIILGSSDHIIYTWNAKTWEAMAAPLKEHALMVSSIAFSPQGKHFASSSYDGTIRIWDVDEVVANSAEENDSFITAIAVSPNGKQILSGSSDDTLCIWDAETGKVVNGPLKGHTNPVTCVAFSQDGKHIMSSAWDKTIRIWDAETGAVMSGPFTLYTDCVLSAAFSPDGKYIITGSKDKTICMWDAKTGEAIGVPLKGHTDCVTSIVFLQDNKHIITGSCDRTIRTWNLETSESVTMPLKGHTGYFTFPAVSPDNKHIIAGSDEHRTISIWDVQTGQYVPVLLKGQPDQIESVAFLPDGHIISGSYNNRICIWNAEINELVATHQSDISVAPKINFSSNPHHALCDVHSLFENTVDITGDWRDAIQIQKDGWILGPQGRRLLWVPHVHLPDLYYPRTKYLIGQVGTQLDLSHFSHGPLWQSCGSL